MSLPKQEHINESQLHAYLDHALEEAGRLLVDAHLSSCHGCREELESLKAFFAEIESLPETLLQTDLAPIVTAAISKNYGISQRWRLAVVSQTILALLVIWISWPMMSTKFILPQLPNISIDLQVIALEISITISSFFDSLINHFRDFFYQLSGTIFEGSSPMISTIYLLPLAISATLLWLVGNRVLLKETNHNGFGAQH